MPIPAWVVKPSNSNLAAYAGIGAAISVVSSGLSKGQTRMPTPDSAVRSTAINTVGWGVVGAGMTRFLGQTPAAKDSWKSSGVHNAFQGAALSVGMIAGSVVASTLGF